MTEARLAIGIFVFPDVEELDFVGPYEVFSQTANVVANGVVAGPGPDVKLVARSLDAIVCAHGMRVLPDATFADCPDFDVLVVPGGRGTRRLVSEAGTLSFIAAKAAKARFVTSVCTGAGLLGAAGLLGGRKATTHWAAMDFLASSAPDATIVRDRRVVEDGNVITSAGVSAGIDMALLLVGRLWGEEAARAAQKGMEYYPEPPYSRLADPI